jgi:anion-transporting  ArsA/GET3 family ATPase
MRPGVPRGGMGFELGCAAMSIFDKRLILVCGKGGVGRSTVAATIAMMCAKRGRTTLLYQTNANDRIGGYFDTAAIGTTVREIAPRLAAVNTTPAAALAEYGMMVLKLKTVYEMVFENRVTKAFLRAIPGLDDYSLLGKAWFHTAEERRGQPVWDTVVFDMPASGHSLSMLRIPTVILETVPEGPLTRDAREVRDLLTDPARTAAVLVTLAEEMPVNEARELDSKLRNPLGIAPQLVAVNQVVPDAFPSGAPQRVLAALHSDPTLPTVLAAVTRQAELMRQRRLLNERYLAEVRAWAAAAVVELPMLFAAKIDVAALEVLSKPLAGC